MFCNKLVISGSVENAPGLFIDFPFFPHLKLLSSGGFIVRPISFSYIIPPFLFYEKRNESCCVRRKDNAT